MAAPPDPGPKNTNAGRGFLPALEVERETGFEPATTTLATLHSTS